MTTYYRLGIRRRKSEPKVKPPHARCSRCGAELRSLAVRDVGLLKFCGRQCADEAPR